MVSKTLGFLEKRIVANKGPYAAGASLTVADLAIYGVLLGFKNGVPGFEKTIADSYENLQRVSSWWRNTRRLWSGTPRTTRNGQSGGLAAFTFVPYCECSQLCTSITLLTQITIKYDTFCEIQEEKLLRSTCSGAFIIDTVGRFHLGFVLPWTSPSLPRRTTVETTIEYKAYVVVWWPLAHDLRNTTTFVGENAALSSILADKPVSASKLRSFMNMATGNDQKDADRDGSRPYRYVDFCLRMCNAIAAAGDVELVWLFFIRYFDSLKKKELLAPSLVSLIEKYGVFTAYKRY
ncbi:Glutathione S-transferase, C-terminal-like [Phytophthora cactorum]|nr:Glutathione S-transferase, C-terminal-like [Phytophthora cactorum]